MNWVENVFNTRALHGTTDALTEEPLTVAFTAAIDHERGDRVAIETLPGTHATVDEFDRACDRERKGQAEGLYCSMVLPLAEAMAFAEALDRFLRGLPPGRPRGPEPGRRVEGLHRGGEASG